MPDLARCVVSGLLCAVLMMVAPATRAEQSPWQEEKSEHFIVVYQNVPRSFVTEVVDSAEAYYRKTMTMLGFTRYKGWSWDRRVRIVVYDSQKSYVGSSHYSWSAAQANPLAREITTFPAENGFFDSTLPHELGHIIFREAVGFHNNIPLWLDEGVATYQQLGHGVGADEAVRELMASAAFIPLEQLDRTALQAGSDQATVNAFYDEAESLFGFLINRYEVYRFERLCHDLEQGRPFPESLKRSYMQFTGIVSLEKAWKEYLNETHTR